jgi:hypothetical protein
VRFIDGDESVESIKKFSDECLNIASVARCVVAAHHSTKEFEKEKRITMQNVLRGSGDFGAMVSTCLGIRQLDEERNLLHVEICGSRDQDEYVPPFQIEGRPHINKTGDFKLVTDDAEPLEHYLKGNGGRPKAISPEIESRLIELQGEGLSNRQMAKELGVSEASIRRWKKFQEDDEALDLVARNAQDASKPVTQRRTF